MNLKPATELIIGNIYYLPCHISPSNIQQVKLMSVIGERAELKPLTPTYCYFLDFEGYIQISKKNVCELDNYIPPTKPKDPIPHNIDGGCGESTPLAY